MIFDDIHKALAFAAAEDLYPDIHTIRGSSTDPEVDVVTPEGCRRVLMFSSNDYLGLANDPRVKRAVRDALETYGMGSGGSKLVTGNTEIQCELEATIAAFKGYEAAMTFSSGFLANIGAIPALVDVIDVSAGDMRRRPDRDDAAVVFSDELNHASIVDACRLARAERVIYRHRDLDHLESELRRAHNARKLIVSDGVFSMDGDIAPLPGIMELAARYDAAVMIDDAHATGVLGANGTGTPEHFRLTRKPHVMMGTFTKAFGAIGGFIAADAEVIEYLRPMARTHMFSAPIPPAIAAGIIEGASIIREERRFEALWRNIDYVVPKLRAAGCDLLASETQIVPILIGDDGDARDVSRALFAAGIFAPCIRWPAVPKGTGRLRLTLMATHTTAHLDSLLGKITWTKATCRSDGAVDNAAPAERWNA